MASLSPAPTPSIERDDTEDVQTENDNAAADSAADGATDGTAQDQKEPRLTPKDLEIIRIFVEELSALKDKDGNEIAQPFQRLPNRRIYDDYYTIIKRPSALSTARAKLLKKGKGYKDWKEFVLDMALIPYNAQVYNLPSSGLFHYATAFREKLKTQLQQLVEVGVMTAEDAALPDLGPLPESEDSPPPDPNEEEVEEDEDEEEEESPDEDSDDGASAKRTNKRGRGRPRLSGNVGKAKYSKAAKEKDEDDEDPDSHKKRGRPPKVLTPMESRINNVLKGLRKFKNDDGKLKIGHFEKLPDKTQMPEYYQTVKNPIAMDSIKKKAKRKKYTSVDAAMKDLELMFENAKSYNLETSDIHKDAVDLQKEARLLAEQEKNKPDSDYMMEDGKIPLPEILHNGELWKVGDWVHIQNPNDLKLPIVAQIYRTWQDQEGLKWINACWYYHPEQTVHHHLKHFFEDEVVKTGQYRDHQVDEIVDRCFVMFFTRYNKGRPRGFPADKKVYVCEARYNEEKFKFNKIKTWASCVPDEVRDRDYEMDLFDHPRKMKKVPSPIAHYLRPEAKEDDPLPKPNWGAPNAPPVMGAVHNGPRDANESPPPEPTPSPPPQPPPQSEPVRRQDSSVRTNRFKTSDTIMLGSPSIPPSMMNGRQQPASTPYGTQFVAPASRVQGQASIPALARSNSFVSQTPNETHRHHMPQSPHTSFPQASYPHQNTPLLPQHSGTPSNTSYDHHRPNSSNTRSSLPLPGANAYNPPRPIEVYTLPDALNNAIPEDIRREFQQDDQGRVHFYAVPPLDASRIPEHLEKLGHSVRYLAKKARIEEEKARKIKERDEQQAIEAEESRKRAREEEEVLERAAKKLEIDFWDKVSKDIAAGTENFYKHHYGDEWQLIKQEDDARAEARKLRDQEKDRIQREELKEYEEKLQAAGKTKETLRRY